MPVSHVIDLMTVGTVHAFMVPQMLYPPLMQMITYTQNDLYFVSHGFVVIRVDVGLGDNKRL